MENIKQEQKGKARLMCSVVYYENNQNIVVFLKIRIKDNIL